MRAEPSPSRDTCRLWDSVSGWLLVFKRKKDGAVNRKRETTMSPSEHDKTHDKLRQWTECAREGVIVLESSFSMASVRIDGEELTYGTPRLKPTPPYAETNSNTTKNH